MKTEIIFGNAKPESKYPYIGRSDAKGCVLLVLFTAPRRGMVISSHPTLSSYKVGETFGTWDE